MFSSLRDSNRGSLERQVRESRPLCFVAPLPGKSLYRQLFCERSSSSINLFQCEVMYSSDWSLGRQNRFYSIGGLKCLLVNGGMGCMYLPVLCASVVMVVYTSNRAKFLPYPFPPPQTILLYTFQLQICCFFLLFRFFSLKIKISTRDWSVRHPNAGRNIQHPVFIHKVK